MKTIEDVAVEMAKSKGTSRDYTFGFLDVLNMHVLGNP